ncbi:MAG: hypothetical protein ABL866_03565 [Devosia sp.]
MFQKLSTRTKAATILVAIAMALPVVPAQAASLPVGAIYKAAKPVAVQIAINIGSSAIWDGAKKVWVSATTGKRVTCSGSSGVAGTTPMICR